MRVAPSAGARDDPWLRGAVWGILVAALVVRLAAAWSVTEETVLPKWASSSTDALVYHDLAQSLIAGEGYVDIAGNVAYRPPGYPFFLAGLYTLFGDANPRVARNAQALLSTLTVLLLMRCAHLLWANRKAMLAAGVVATAYPFFLFFVPLLLTETLFSCLSVAALWALLEARRTGRLRWPLIAGVCCALAALTRPTMLPVAFAVSIYAAWAAGRPRAGVVLLVAALVTIAPWTARNYMRTGMLVPISTNGAIILRKANVPEHEAVSTDAARVEDDASREVVESRANLRLFVLHASRHPIDFLAESLLRAVRFWSPWPLGQPRAVQWLGLVTFTPLLLAAPVALRRLWASQRRDAWLLIAFAGTFYAVHVLSVVHIRFRVPVVDPVMILLAAGMLAPRLPRRG